MSHERVHTGNAPEPIGPYSQAIKTDNGFIFTSGQIPIDPKTGNVIDGGIKEQTKQVMENMKAVLERAGSKLSNVIKTTVFLKSMDDFPAMNEIYSQYFGESKPARSTVEVSKLPKDVLVEIDAVAYLVNLDKSC